MKSRDRQDTDTNVGRGDPGSDVGPTSGRAASPSTDDALGLGGAPEESREEREDPAGDYGSGLETGEASRGSSANAAQRMDRFNTPDSHG